MRKIFQLILLLSIVFSCVCQKKQSSKSKKDITESEKQIPISKPNISPGTFALNIKVIEIIKKDNLHQVKAIINKKLGMGAGLTRIFSVGEKISFEINQDRNLLLNTDYKILFKEVLTIGNNKNKIQFIKEIK